MLEGLKSCQYHSELPKTEMVYWADIIHRKPLSLSEKDDSNPGYIDEKYTKASASFKVEDHEIRRKVVDFLGRQLKRIFLNEDLSLNYSYITDTIVSTYFKDLEIYYTEKYTDENGQECMMHELIRERLVTKLREHRNDEIMLISHSMGSIIAFDVLSFTAPDIKINTFITMGSPLGLPVVISKIALEQKKKGHQDKLMITPPGIIKNWYNFSDILDKVAFNYKLSDDFTENSHGIKPVDFLVINNYEVNGTHNPHKSFGYLRAPEFSKILNDFKLSEKLTMKQKIIQKIAHYVDSLKSQLSKHKNPE